MGIGARRTVSDPCLRGQWPGGVDGHMAVIEDGQC